MLKVVYQGEEDKEWLYDTRSGAVSPPPGETWDSVVQFLHDMEQWIAKKSTPVDAFLPGLSQD